MIRRSTLIMPVNNEKFVNNAWSRRADAIQLDLEDSIPGDEKDSARQLVKTGIEKVGRGGGDVLVRINSEKKFVKKDLEASIWPGLHSIVIPKVETISQVQYIEKIINQLEKEKNIKQRTIKLGILIETAKGFNNMREILLSSDRIETVNLGTEDFLLDIEAKLVTGNELLYPKLQTIINAKELQIQPLGMLRSMTNFKDLDSLRENARQSYMLGFKGASCIHPSQVSVLNQNYMPSFEEIENAEQVISTYEISKKKGASATQLKGRMVDTPIAEKAYLTIKRKKDIDRFEEKKDQCINSNEML